MNSIKNITFLIASTSPIFKRKMCVLAPTLHIDILSSRKNPNV